MIGRRRFLQASASALAVPSLAARAQTSGAAIRVPSRGAAFELTGASGQRPMLAAFRHGATGFEWGAAGHPIVPPLAVDGARQADWTFVSHGSEPAAVRLVSSAPDGLRCVQQIRGFGAMPAFAVSTIFEAPAGGTARRVSACGALRLPLRSTLGPLQAHVMRRDKYAVERLPIEGVLEIAGGGWNQPSHAGLVVIEALAHHECLIVGVEWERGWRCRITQTPEASWLTVDLEDFAQELTPGATLAAPPVFLVMATGDVDAAVNAAHRFLKTHVYPAPLPNSPWVVYDFWSTDPQGVEEATQQEIDFAADLGVELFYVDAAWYHGSSTRGTGDWGCGLGSYQEDRRKFPQGLAALSTRVHDRGMKFGLWVGPNIVDRRLVPGEVPRQWIAQLDGQDRVLTIPQWEAPCLQVCLGCADYAAHLQRELIRLVETLQLDWLKWDNSGIPGIPGQCNRADHGHDPRGGSDAALRATYAIFGELHRRFPALVLEQCGYGSRHDVGLARTIRANWMSDASFPASHVRENALVGRFAYPTFYNGGWVLREDPALEQAKTAAQLDTLYRSRMIGLFGFGTLNGKLSERVSLLPPAVIEAGRRNIVRYKRYRHLLHGDSYLLTPPAGNAERWQAVQFVGTAPAHAGESVVLAFRNDSTQSRLRLPLRGLDPAASYSVTSAAAGDPAPSAGTSGAAAPAGSASRRLSGRALMDVGLTIDLAEPDGSDVILLTRA